MLNLFQIQTVYIQLRSDPPNGSSLDSDGNGGYVLLVGSQCQLVVLAAEAGQNSVKAVVEGTTQAIDFIAFGTEV